MKKKEREKDPYLLRNERNKEGGERVKRRGWRKGGGGR